MRIVVAMSGGVDSAVAAASLARGGHEVIGVTLRLADLSAHGLGVSRCCSADDVETARRVAWHLGFAHYAIDAEDVFRRDVLDLFVDSYLTGDTPSPCVRCNSRVKFRELLALARQVGADVLATGHYARCGRDETGSVVLLRGKDRSKDQSYFLFELTREQLDRVMFPLGELTKDEVRERARELGLPNATQPDSQEVCFVPAGKSYVDVVEKLAPERLAGHGEVVDAGGTVVGTHAGAHRFTVGQRRGLAISSARRLYVLSVDPGHNRVVVGERAEAARRTITLRETNWLAARLPGRFAATVQIRSRHEPAAAQVTVNEDGGAVVEFETPILAPAPGQAAVCYDGDRVLGGGWITRHESVHIGRAASFDADPSGISPKLRS